MADDVVAQYCVHLLALDRAADFVDDRVAAGDALAHFLGVFRHAGVHDHDPIFTHQRDQVRFQHCNGGEVVVQNDGHARAAHLHHADVLQVELVDVDAAFVQAIQTEVALPDRFALVVVEVVGRILQDWLRDVELAVNLHAIGFK